jgi:hypothetical protein
MNLAKNSCNTHVLVIGGESVVDARGQHNQIALLEPDSDPIVAFTADVEKPRAVEDIPDLLVLVQVLVEKRLDLLFVNVTHFLGRYNDLVAVLVAALHCQFVDVGLRCDVLVQHAELRQVRGVHGAPRVVREALVALQELGGVYYEIIGTAYRQIIIPVCFHCGGGMWCSCC